MSPFCQLPLIRAVFWGRGSNKNTRRCSSVMKLSCHWSVCLNPARLREERKKEFRVPCNVQLQFNRRVSISRCPFQGCRREVTTRSSVSLRQVLMLFSILEKVRPNTKTKPIQNTPGDKMSTSSFTGVCPSHTNTHWSGNSSWQSTSQINIFLRLFCFKILK